MVNWRWTGLGAAVLLLGCSAEGLDERDVAGERKQSVTVQSACVGVTAQPPAPGRYKVLKVKAGTDTIIWQEKPDRGYPNEVACQSSPDEVCLVRFPIDLPETAQIHFAQLTLSIEASSQVPQFARTMNKRWTEAGATWNSYQTGSPWTTPGAKSDIRSPFCDFTAQVGRVTYNLPGHAVAEIQDWVSGVAENSGIGFFHTDLLRISSSEGLLENAPELTLWYTDEPVAAQRVTLKAVASTTIAERSPDANFSHLSACEAGGRSPAEMSCLLRWDTSGIPVGSLVTRVQIHLGRPVPSPRICQLSVVRRPWVEAQATWNAFATGRAWATPGAIPGDVGARLGFATPITGRFFVEPATYSGVQRWADDPQGNLGALLAYSRLHGGKSNPWTLDSSPELFVTFTPP